MNPLKRLQHSRYKFVLPVMIISLAVLAVFWPVVQADFVEWDDGSLIYRNPNYHPVTPESLLKFWRQPYQKLYTPLTYSVMGVLAVAGRVPPGEPNPPSSLTPHLDPRVFHSFSLLVHLLSALLVWTLLLQITKSNWGACAGAALWALHPLQVETVAWAGEIKGLLAAFFSLGALSLYAFFVRRTQKHRPALTAYVAATACFLLALLSKPSAVCLPLVAAAIAYFLLRSSARSTLLPLVPWLVIAIPFVWVARGAQPVPAEVSPLWGRPFIAGDALAFYFARIVFPVDLKMIYGRTPEYVLSHWWGYGTWLIPLGVAVVAWRVRRRFPYLLAAAAIFTAAILPNLGLAPFIYQRFSTVADRYAYLAMLGPALLLAGWIASKTPNLGTNKKEKTRFNVLAVLIATWLLLLGVRTALHVPNWQSSLALWTYNIRVDPNNWALVNNVGVRKLEQGQPAEALVHLRKAARLRPDDPEARAALATAKFQVGRIEDAREDFQKALQVKPGYGRALLGLGNIAREEGEAARAQAYYEQALKSGLEREDAATAQINMGALLSSRGQQDEAIDRFKLALQATPNDAQAHDSLALAYARKGDLQLAETHWQEAVRLDPTFAAARINYGTLLAMQERYDEAVSQWQEALQLLPDSASEKVSTHHNLAVVLWNQGDSTRAIENWRAALRLDPDYAPAQRSLQEALDKTSKGAAASEGSKQ